MYETYQTSPLSSDEETEIGDESGISSYAPSKFEQMACVGARNRCCGRITTWLQRTILLLKQILRITNVLKGEYTSSSYSENSSRH